MSRLLINEEPLQVLPGLAEKIGLNEAIVLQQLHYWLSRSTQVKDGEKWVYNTYDEWCAQFPFWSKATVRRVFTSLEKQGLIITGEFNRHSGDRTKWYRIDYEAMPEVENDHVVKTSTPPSPQVLNVSKPSAQNEQVQKCSKRAAHIPETTRDYNRESAREEWQVPKGEDPVEVFNEAYATVPPEHKHFRYRMNVLEQPVVRAKVKDMSRWRQTVDTWVRAEYSPRSARSLLDYYEQKTKREWKPKLNLYTPPELQNAATA